MTDSSRDTDLLAAEHALGVLEGEALQTARDRARTDPEFAASVEAWSLKLAPLAEHLPETAPPAALKQRIEAAVFGEAAPSAPAAGGLWASLGFWRGAAAALAATTVIAAALAIRPGEQTAAPEPELYAALQANSQAPALLIRFDPETRRLSLAGPLDPGAGGPVQPELWVIAPGQAPRSLGLIAARDGALSEAMILDEAVSSGIADGAVLAISLEPPGGSPTGAPTGPVIASGEVRRL